MPKNTAAAKRAPARTKAQIAQETLATAQRQLQHKSDRLIRLRRQVEELEQEVKADSKRVDYLAMNPDLPQGAGKDVGSEESSA